MLGDENRARHHGKLKSMKNFAITDVNEYLTNYFTETSLKRKSSNSIIENYSTSRSVKIKCPTIKDDVIYFAEERSSSKIIISWKQKRNL